jgi:hypothetical protein
MLACHDAEGFWAIIPIEASGEIPPPQGGQCLSTLSWPLIRRLHRLGPCL